MTWKQSIKGAAEAFETLMVALHNLDLSDQMARQPSLLPGWSIGHVLTHLARTANGYERMVRASLQGQIVDQYPGGATQRQEEIEVGSDRRASELLKDLVLSEAALSDSFSQLTTADWARRTRRWGSQPWPVSDIPFLRWREVSIHTIDLGLRDLTLDVWSDAYVERELRRQLATLPSRLYGRTLLDISPTDKDWDLLVLGSGDGSGPVVTIEGTSREILAWQIGRAEPPSSWPLLPAWLGVP